MGLHPMPLLVHRVTNLKSGDGLTEEEGKAPEVAVSTDPDLANLLVLLRRELAILHVTEMILENIRTEPSRGGRVACLALDFIFVNIREIVLRKLKGDGEKGVERVQNLRMERTSEFFNLVNVLLNNPGVILLEVTVELLTGYKVIIIDKGKIYHKK